MSTSFVQGYFWKIKKGKGDVPGRRNGDPDFCSHWHYPVLAL